MKRALALLAILLALTLSVAQAGEARTKQPKLTRNEESRVQLSPAQLVARTKKSVVAITTLGADGQPLMQGSGFFFSKDGDILTNYHVVKGASTIMVTAYDGRVNSSGNVVCLNEDLDLAILEFPTLNREGLTCISVYCEVAHLLEGEHVLVIGNPEGFYGTVSDGLISAIRANGILVQISAPISPGSSGSPVIDDYGRVIGMASMGNVNGQNLNFAISCSAINAWIKRQNAFWTNYIKEKKRGTNTPME